MLPEIALALARATSLHPITTVIPPTFLSAMYQGVISVLNWMGWLVVELVNVRGRAEESDAILLVVLRHAASDDLAARTVLQAMMPAVKNLTAKFSTCGAWSAEETAAVVVAAMWERIRTYPVARRPKKVAANLALDTRQRVWRSGYKLVYGRLPPKTRAAA